MINGYCEEKYNSVKNIFESYFLKQEEIGASFAIYKEGKPLIDLWGGFQIKDNKKCLKLPDIFMRSLRIRKFKFCIRPLVISVAI